MKNKSVIITFIISFFVVGSLVAVFTFDKAAKEIPVSPVKTDAQPVRKTSGSHKPLLQPVIDEPAPQPAKAVSSVDFDKAQSSPGELMNALVDLLKNPQADTILEDMKKRNVLDQSVITNLAKILSSGNTELDEKAPLREVGTWDNGKRVRFEVTFRNGSQGTVDFELNSEKKWVVTSMNLASGKIVNVGDDANMYEMADSMAVADAFARAALSSDLRKMRSLIDSETVNGATLVGLCILFEEGQYSLRKRMPIKGMFGTDKNAGFLAYLVDASGKSAGNIGMSLKRKENKGWVVSEVSLNSLLDDFAKRASRDDSVYVPIVKNPKGGDSLAMFFGFNEYDLTPRSIKQLHIVAEVVKMDDKKKIEISGHTDDIGSDQYNMDLSQRRAQAVKKALMDNGVPESRIDTKAFGKKQPRRTYATTADEITKQEARRDNRRAEMYLDF